MVLNNLVKRFARNLSFRKQKYWKNMTVNEGKTSQGNIVTWNQNGNQALTETLIDVG